MNIKQMLESYLENQAKVLTGKADIQELEKMLQYDEVIRSEAVNDAIEGECMPAPALSHIPRSETNKFHSSTEDAAINYKDRVWYTSGNEVYYLELLGQDERKRIHLEILQIKKDILPNETHTSRVEALLSSLNDKEHFVITLRCIRGYNISEVIHRFANQFGYGSKGTIENIEKEALEKMEKIGKRKRTA